MPVCQAILIFFTVSAGIGSVPHDPGNKISVTAKATLIIYSIEPVIVAASSFHIKHCLTPTRFLNDASLDPDLVIIDRDQDRNNDPAEGIAETDRDDRVADEM